MPAPTAQLSRLSLETMPPMTRSKSRGAATSTQGNRSSTDPDSSDSDSDSSSLYDDNESPSFIRSPSSKLRYRLDQLSDANRSAVRDTFTDPPKITLQGCRRIDDTYAFQMTELVPRSVRIRAQDNGGASRLTCSCRDPDDPDFCPHLVWLLDGILKQTLYDHPRSDPVTMLPTGHAQELGDPFQTISRHHLDILAAGLHCPVVDPDSYGLLDRTRNLETRELLSAVYDTSPDHFRPDIFETDNPGTSILKRHDLDRTIARMLIDNTHFFHYFLSQCTFSDPVNDSFRKLSQRIDLVIHSLDHPSTSLEPPPTVSWAAYHILGSVEHIRSAIFSRDKPLPNTEALSATSALVHILDLVVAHNSDTHANGPRRERNLYLRLVGDRDRDFVIGVLALIPEAASQFVNDIERLLEQISLQGAPASYVVRFRALLARLKTSGLGSGLKRSGQTGADRRSKRMK